MFDYSILAFILQAKDPQQQLEDHEFHSQCSGVRYKLSLIDYLQEYTLYRKSEKLYKKARAVSSTADLSVQQPAVYRRRMLTFISQSFED